MSSPPENSSSFALLVFGAVVVGVALIGFLRGTAEDDYDFTTPLGQAQASVDGEVRSAPSYREWRDTPRAPRSGFSDDLERLGDGLPDRSDPVELTGAKAVDLAARAQRRAYDGAPPTIPHPVRQSAASECKACHERGIQLAGRTAPAYPHRDYEVCVQCHAMEQPATPWGTASAGLAPDPRAGANSFEGLAAPEEGPRWTGIAPPQIPHRTFMHERCDSCHGPTGRNAMRSTHPDRQNCEQCHASQAELEWRPGGRR